MATGLERTAVSPHTMQAGQAAPQRPSLTQTAMNPLARAYQLYQQYVGEPFQQTVRGGVRGYFGLPMMTDASSVGREAYRQGEALGFTPGVGMPAGAVRVAAEGMQALPSIAGDIGRVISGLPSGAAARQAEDFAAYQRSIPPADVSPLTAFHGTPHTFAAEEGAPLGRFRAGKIGSGEGAQAYGYGLYFAENPGVAGSYKETLSPKNFAKIEEKGRNSFDVIAPDGQVLAQNVYRGAAQKAKDAFDAKQKGSLYTVDIPDAMVDRMLDWDKPLSQQAPEVRKSLESLGYKIDAKAKTKYSEDLLSALFENSPAPTGKIPSDPMGSEIARGTGIFDRPQDKVIAERLRQAGIPGIRYLDQSSRAGGEGTRNIVVFPGEEQNVKILSRE